MTNEQKYKTPEERTKAFITFCRGFPDCERDGRDCPCFSLPGNCAYNWLALEAEEAEEEKPLPCPFCGADGIITEVKGGGFKVFCVECLSMSSAYLTKDEAVATWNRRAK